MGKERLLIQENNQHFLRGLLYNIKSQIVRKNKKVKIILNKLKNSKASKDKNFQDRKKKWKKERRRIKTKSPRISKLFNKRFLRLMPFQYKIVDVAFL